ncbi:tRNA (adenosine(37)-N6)-threonylcarbamoyltransferase complex ATPase subunit type 1 TsaE [Actinobaculum suis]|nr:tRNA (adenosine(37)-N6)-threonylcarbamoyltransferase complex ATPase subunit type 1 TsaE [Actinobaculum suis]
MERVMKEIVIPDAEEMQSFGRALGESVQRGDLVMLTGPLGAGKTTLVRGVAAGMNVSGRVTSPTFVIANVHKNRGTGPDLIHVDAYRLEGLEELDALDLDTSLEDSATLIEWGTGKVEVLSPDRLEITITRPEGAARGQDVADLYVDAPRTLTFTATGQRAHDLLAETLHRYQESTPNPAPADEEKSE